MSEEKTPHEAIATQTDMMQRQVNSDVIHVIESLQNGIKNGDMNSSLLQGTVQHMVTILTEQTMIEQSKRLLSVFK